MTGIRRILLLSSACLLSPSIVWAQGAPSGEAAARRELQEVVVTARKRAESLQDVPVAVASISQVELQNNLATDLNKVAELAPQVIIGRGVNGTGALITIRGISSTSNDSGLDQSVSVSIDGIQLSRGRIVSASLFDMAQVDILQGPQALFFGKNSPAGVVAMRSADPTSSFEGSVKAGYEFNAKERFVEGVVSGPLTDTLGARLAFRADKMDGWLKNVAQPTANPFQPAIPMPGRWADKMPGGHDLAARLTLQWRPTDDFEAKLKFMVDKQHLNSNGAYVEGFCLAPTLAPVELGVPLPGGDCQKDRVVAQSAIPANIAAGLPWGNSGVPYNDVSFSFGSLTLNKEIDNITLVSTTGFYRQLHVGAHSSDFTPFAQNFNPEREVYDLLTQEFRVSSAFESPINFMVGAYIEKADRRWYGSPEINHVFNPATGNYIMNFQKTDSDNDNWSVFGELSWKIMPTLELSGGARYSKDKKSTTYLNLVNNQASPIARTLYPQGVPLTAKYKDDNVSPEVTLTWKPDTDNTVYAAYKTGYKAGGLSNPVLLPASANQSALDFGPEKAKGFEAGYKADLLARTLRVDLVAYRYNYKGLQVTSFDPVALRNTINNAANARTTGVTASAKWLATDNLSLDGTLGYNEAKYINFRTAPCYTGQTAALGCVIGTPNAQNLSGKRLNRAPKITFNLGADYKVELPEGWTADLAVNGAYTSSYQAHTDYAPGGFQDSFWRLNASARLSSPDSRVQFDLIGRNLTNAYYMVYTATWPSVGNPNQYIGVFNRPREVVLQATYRF